MDSQEKNIPDIESHLQENTLLRFRVGPFRFAVPATEVEGIIIPPALTRIPLNPPHSKGVFMYHQRLASAISLRSKFGLTDSDDPDFGQLILGEVSAGLVAFWVDEVYETVDTNELEWRAMPEFIPHAAFDSFAVKGDEVVLSTTMQHLYEVPAETAAQLLQSVRDSFDLPQDVPPVASETMRTTEDADVFGDLMSDQAEETAIKADTGRGETDESTQPTLTASNGEGMHTAINAANDSPARQPADESTGDARVGATAGKNHVLNFPGNRTGRPTANNPRQDEVSTPARLHDDARTQQAAARTSARFNQGPAIEARRIAAEHARPSATGAAGRQRGFVGGTHAAAVNQLHQHRYRDDIPSSDNFGSMGSGSEKYSKRWLWLLAALLLLALVAFVAWPDKKREVISSFPTQNYQSNYSFRESTSAPAVPEPRSSYEAVSPPPVASGTREKPEQVKTESTPPTNSETPAAPVRKNSDEIYRLEGKDVTLTVERNRPVPDKIPATSATQQISPAAGQSEAIPSGYDEFVHIVVKGDTLWDIAARYLKNPFRYPELAQLSKISNPDLIYPGDTVRIRAKQK